MKQTGISFKDFANLANRKGWTPEYLTERFRGKIDNPSQFFHRCLDSKNKNMIIPYRSIISLYQEELNSAASDGSIPSCLCGCKRRVHGKKKYFSGACRVKIHRQESRTLNI